MNRIEDYAELTDNIVKWISDYCLLNKRKTLVVGISGGIDSSVVSTLSALTGMKTYVVGMPINQIEGQEELSDAHGKWLQSRFSNVTFVKTDMSKVYDSFLQTINDDIGDRYATDKLAQAQYPFQIQDGNLISDCCICWRYCHRYWKQSRRLWSWFLY